MGSIIASALALLRNGVYAVGFCTTGYFLIQFTQHLRFHLRGSSIALYNSDKRSWAMVTGASDGIGFALSKELCRNDFNVILHGRNREKLQGVEAVLKHEYPASEVRLFIADAFASPFPATAALEAVKDVRLTILVNNVGGGAVVKPSLKLFDDHSHAEIDAVIDCNARFATHLTQTLLPVLRASAPHPALIINTSSFAALGVPYVSVYSGSKGYITAWTKAVNAELIYERANVRAMSMLVGNVQSQLQPVPESFTCPSSETFAQSVIRTIGVDSSTVSPYWPHALQLAMVQWMPEWLFAKFAADSVQGRLKEFVKTS